MQRLTVPFLLIPALLTAAQTSKVTLHASATAEFGHTVTLTAVVSPAAATGQITFYKGTTILETEPVAEGKAILTTSLLPAGTSSLSAYYSGDSTYAPSKSAIVSETVKTSLSNQFGAPFYSYSLSSDESGGPIALADFNGDGKIDMAVSGGSGALVFLGNGDGTFQPPTSLTGATGSGNIAIGDFSGNGIADIVVDTFSTSGRLFVFYGNGDGTFQPAVETQINGTYPVVADFNGDGKADIAASCDAAYGEVCVALGNGAGGFGPVVAYPANDASEGNLAVGDFNNDGKADIVVSNGDSFGGGVSVLFGNGDGTFQAPKYITDLPEDGCCVVADFNGDGNLDIAVNGAVFLGSGDGTFQPPIANPYVGGAADAVTDFNADGKLDLVAGSSVLLGNGDGTFQTPTPTDGAYESFAVADLTGNGRVDIVGYVPTSFPQYNPPAISDELGTLTGPTTTTLVLSSNPAFYGMPVTLTATVSPSTVEGEVTFYTNSPQSITLGTAPLKDGKATLTPSTFPLGMSSLYATYPGNASVPDSLSPDQVLTVTIAPTSTTLLSSPNPSSVGQTVTLLAQMTPAYATGNVQFSVGSKVLGTSAIVNGNATFSISTLPQGEHKMTATFLGGADFSPSVSFIVYQNVN
jgi:hypothetical protein